VTTAVDRPARGGDDDEGSGATTRRRFLPLGLGHGRSRRASVDVDADGADSGGVDGGDGDPDDDKGDGKPRRRRSAGRWALWLALRVSLVLLVVGIGYLAVTFVQVRQASRSDSARASDAIVVLGAAQYDCVPSPVLEHRLDRALALYEDGVAPQIVVTGGKRAGDRCTEAEAGALYLLQRGVPDADILREVKGRNTWESIAASALFLTERGDTRVVLVTDDYHALRVRAIADELGLEAVVSPVGANASLRELAKETGAVAVGRIVGFRRLVDIDDRLVIDPGS
jgi:uncharacterized SAM-binding protein YcdF (DUF218 family)